MTSRAAPLLSGLLLALALPPLPTTPILFVSLLPLGVWLAGLPSEGGGARQAWWGGLGAGLVLWALALHWIPFSVSPPWAGAVAYGAAVALLAPFPAVASVLTHRAIHRHGAPLWLALPVAWTGAEWLRGHLPLGLAFPWLGPAAGLAGAPQALVLAEWVGERGVTFWIVLVNGLACEALLRGADAPGQLPAGGPRAARRWALGAALVVLLPVAWGALHARRWTPPPAVAVSVVRTDLDRTGREDPGSAAVDMDEALQRLLPTLEAGAADVVILPETAFPLLLAEEEGTVWRDRLATHAARRGAPLLVGGLAAADAGGVHNSVFLLGAEGITDRYDKRRLVPGVERAPLLPSRYLLALGDGVSYRAGWPASPLEVEGLGVGVLVCYESAFAGLARDHQRAGARVLVNVTNDGWFRDPLGAGRAQHEAHLVLRAVEGRIGVARAANRGAALVVAPTGRVTRLPGEGEAMGVLDLHPGRRLTPYVRFGDLLGVLAAVGSLLWLLPSPAPRRGGRPGASRLSGGVGR